jgi:hypothetical protein
MILRFILALALLFQQGVVVKGPANISGPGVVSAGVNSSVTFDAASISASIISGTTVSWNHTVGAGTHQVLVVSLQGSGPTGAATATCTYNSITIPFITSKIDAGNGNAVALFILPAPSVGTFSIACTWGATIAALVGEAESWFGVNQSTPNRTAITSNGGVVAGPTSVVVSNAVSGDMVIDVMTVNATAGIAVTGSQTQRNLRTNVGGNNFSAGSSSLPASGSTTMGWTYTGSHPWAEIGVALIPG